MGGLLASGNRNGTRCGRRCYGRLCDLVSTAGNFARRWDGEGRGQLCTGWERSTGVVIGIRVGVDNEGIKRICRRIGVAMGERLG